MRYTIVTCATSHLGQDLVKYLAEQGHPMILLGRNKDKLNNLKKAITANGFKWVKTKLVDFSCSDSTSDFTVWLSKEKLQLRGTVIITPRPKLKDALFPFSHEWLELFQTCFIGPLEIIKSSIPYYDNSAKVLIVSGISSLQVMPEHAAFGSLRSTWLAHAKALSYQLGPKGIHVNTISPGGILTNYMVDLIQQKAERNGVSYEEQYAKSVSNVPLGKYSSVKEMSQIVEFFLSNKSDHITGVNMACDGGFTRAY